MMNKPSILLKSFALCLILAVCNTAFAQLVGWQYKVPVVITETSGTAISNYQVGISFDTQTLINSGKMNVDASDLRVGEDILGSSLLYHWIERGINTTNTIIWVKIPFIAANDSVTIYFFYGNPSALSTSNVDSTLDAFSDGAIPGSTTQTNNTIPFGRGDGTWGTYKGFTYQNIEEFFVLPGSQVCFDLGAQNDIAITINLDICSTTSNGSSICDGTGYVNLLSGKTASTPFGNTVCSDFELCFDVDSTYHFAGQGMKFRISAAGGFLLDNTSNYNLCYTNSADVSGKFVGRFWDNENSSSADYIGGFILDGYTRTNTVSPEPSQSIGSESFMTFISVNDIQICSGDSAILTAMIDSNSSLVPPYTFSWTPATGLNCDTCQSTYASPTTTTIYTVIVTDSNGIQDSATATVTVSSSLPIANAGTDTSFCEGDSIQLNGSGGVTFSWSPGTSLSDSLIANPIASPGVTTNYIFTTSNGCGTDYDTILISIAPLPVLLSTDTSLCPGDSIQLAAFGAVTYNWSPGSSLNDSMIATPYAQPSLTTTYSLSATSAMGCILNETIMVIIDSVPEILASSSNDTICLGDTAQLFTNACTNGIFYDGFESGNIGTWVDEGGSYTKQLTTNTPYNGTFALEFIGGAGTHLDGLSHSFTSSTPDNISLYMKSTSTTEYGGFFVVGADPIGSVFNDPLIYLFMNDDGTFYLNSGSVGSYNANQWHFIELRNIDFISKTYDFYIDNILISASEPFQNTALTSIDIVHLYTWSSTANSYFDNVAIGKPCNPLDSSINISWNPTIGLSDPNISNPMASPTSTTTYIVEANIGSCISSDTITIYVDTVNTITVSADTALCVGDSLQLNASGALNYVWSPTTGLSCTNCSNPFAGPTADITYTVTSSAGCAPSDSVIIDVNGVDSLFLTSTKDSICPGDTTQLNVSGSCSNGSGQTFIYSENFTGGASYIAGSPQYDNWGTFRSQLDTAIYNFTRVTIKGSNDPVGITCTDPATVNLIAEALRSSNIGVSYTCDGIVWNISDCSGTELNANNTGTGCTCENPGYTIRPEISNDNWGGINGLTCGALSQTMTVEFESEACNTLDSTAIYTWSPSTSLSDPNIANPIANPTSTTTYIVIVDDSGCINTDSITIYVTPLITNAGLDLIICPGDSAQLTATSNLQGVTYSWNPSNSLTCTTCESPIALPINTTTYDVLGSVGNCTSIDSVTIFVNTLPNADAGVDTGFCFGSSVQLTATGGINYQWSPSSYTSCTLCDKTSVNPPSDMTYYVTITDSIGCSAMDSVFVTVNGQPISAQSAKPAVCSPGDTTQLFVNGGCSSGSGLNITYSENFTTGVGYCPGDVQYDNWGAFRSQLDTNIYNFSKVTIKGSLDNIGRICTDQVMIKQMAGCLKDGIAGSWVSCGGFNWTVGIGCVGGCGLTIDGLEFNASGTDCACDNFGYTLRPCIGNGNWGGINGTTCSAATQTMIVEFEYGPCSIDSSMNFSWTPGSSLSDSSILNPVASPTTTTTYIVTAEDQGCFTSDTITIYIDSTIVTAFSDTSICSGESAQLNVTSNTAVASYGWNPSASLSNSTAPNPIATPTTTTSYSVKVTNTLGCQNYDTVTVTVDAPPNAMFTYSANGLTVQFNDVSTNASTWEWDFGNGFNAIIQNPQYAYSTAGTYFVCLVVSNACDSATYCDTITITDSTGCPPPTANFSYSSIGFDATFTNSSTISGNASYSWDFGDGFGSSLLQNPSYSYATYGTFNVCLTITDSCGIDSICQPVIIIDSSGCPPPTASFTYIPNILSVAFTNSSTTSGNTTYNWDFGDGSGFSTAQDPSYIYTLSGTYNVCLTIQDSCGADTICQTISIIDSSACPPPTAGFTFTSNGLNVTFTNTSIVSGNATYTWDFDDGGSSSQPNPIYNYISSGIYNVCLTISDSCGSDFTCQTINTSDTLSITNIAFEDLVEVFPNPTNGIITIVIPKSSANNLEISIYSMIGKLVWMESNPAIEPLSGSKDLNKSQIDIKELSAGPYLIKIQSQRKLYVEEIILNK